ncbi:MAG TPA: LysR substrate-binding domain-containing protein [Gemmatimonadaceae bacterium]|nr:LysR substrate-binding domain-containing protein [Gemmatimonadaceae bacterium]
MTTTTNGNGTLLIRQFQYLVALARERHFARAAAACHVTQPTLSSGIKQREESLGVLVVERGQRFRGLTPEGERVLAWARRITADVQSLRQDVDATRGELSGRLRVGVVPSALPMIAMLTAPFAERHPGTSITVTSLTSSALERALEEFEIDAGVTYLEDEPLGRLQVVPLYHERYVLVTPARSSIGARARDTVTWHEAASLPLCLLTTDMRHRRIIDGHFREAGVTPAPRVEADSMEAVCAHVRHGVLSGVLPQAALTIVGDTPGPTLRVIPLTEPAASHAVGLVTLDRDPPTPIAAAFRQIAREMDIEAVLNPSAHIAALKIG